MNKDINELSKPLLLLSGVLTVLILTAFIPAKWVGVKPPKSTYTPIDFTKFGNIKNIATDNNNNGEIEWGELISSTDASLNIQETAQDQKPDPEVIKQLNDPNNLTASFSKNLYIASAEMVKGGVQDANTQQSVLNQVIADEAVKITSKKYSYSEIRVAQSETKDTEKAYGNAMAKILNALISKQKISDNYSALEFYLQTNNPEYLKTISDDIADINPQIDKLLLLSVPPSASFYHLLVLNKVTEYRDMLHNLSVADADPMRTTLAFKTFPSTVVATLELYKTLGTYFNLKNVIFTQQESGYVFTVGYTLE